MSQTVMDGPVQVAETTHATDPRGRMITRIIVLVGFALVVALFLLLIFSEPAEDPKRTTIGFSLNSLFVWLGGLHPIAQIPLILVIFAAVVGIVLVLIEYAPRAGRGYFFLRLAACLLIPVFAFMLLRPYANAVLYVVAISLLVGGLLFFADFRSRKGAGYLFQLVMFMTPAIVMLLLGLIYPAVATVVKSFFDKTGENFVWFENYEWVFTNPVGTSSVINTIIWALFAPIVSVGIGLAYAAFIDKARGEKILKVLVFMPVAISFVGAGIIWKFMYDYRQGDQIGLLNAIFTAFGGDPVNWLAAKPILNTIMLLIVFVWTQTGFAMVILSAAIQAVPTEQLEAAELDGTNAWQRFRNVTFPGIRSSFIVVLTTITIMSLKVYDIVAVMTGGRDETSVLGFEMVNQQQRFQSYGHSSALAVVLFLFVLPLIIYNARSLSKQREIR